MRASFAFAVFAMVWQEVSAENSQRFVASEQTGFGYFKNFATTRRQGIELDCNAKAHRAPFGGEYTLLQATFESRETVRGSNNSAPREMAG